MTHSAVFMPHWQEQSCSRTSLRTAFFCTGVRLDRSTSPSVSEVFQESAALGGACADSPSTIERQRKAMRTRMPLLSPGSRVPDRGTNCGHYDRLLPIAYQPGFPSPVRRAAWRRVDRQFWGTDIVEVVGRRL